jgi:hypothetical protein
VSFDVGSRNVILSFIIRVKSPFCECKMANNRCANTTLDFSSNSFTIIVYYTMSLYK